MHGARDLTRSEATRHGERRGTCASSVSLCRRTGRAGALSPRIIAVRENAIYNARIKDIKNHVSDPNIGAAILARSSRGTAPCVPRAASQSSKGKKERGLASVVTVIKNLSGEIQEA